MFRKHYEVDAMQALIFYKTRHSVQQELAEYERQRECATDSARKRQMTKEITRCQAALNAMEQEAGKKPMPPAPMTPDIARRYLLREIEADEDVALERMENLASRLHANATNPDEFLYNLEWETRGAIVRAAMLRLIQKAGLDAKQREGLSIEEIIARLNQLKEQAMELLLACQDDSVSTSIMANVIEHMSGQAAKKTLEHLKYITNPDYLDEILDAVEMLNLHNKEYPKTATA